MSLSFRSFCGRSGILVLMALPLLMGASGLAEETTRVAGEAPDSVAVLETVRAFHEALAAGDSVGALSLLTTDALIAESGHLETKDEYRSHHLPADMAFASAVSRSSSVAQLRVRGTTAWVVSTSVTSGTYRDRAIESNGVELAVLTRIGEDWKISAIHWSSPQSG